jgi:hypothetical protein
VHIRMARYRTESEPRDLARRAAEGMLPIFEQQAGFRSYALAAAGDEVWSYSVWDSAESAEVASALAAGWVAQNMPSELKLIERKVGELLLSTALGVVP